MPRCRETRWSATFWVWATGLGRRSNPARVRLLESVAERQANSRGASRSRERDS
jgi:hypothetical protein